MKVVIFLTLLVVVVVAAVTSAAPAEEKPRPKVVFPKSTKALLKNMALPVPKAAVPVKAASKPAGASKSAPTTSAPVAPPKNVELPKAVPIKSLDDLKRFFNKGDSILRQ